jgi:plastocyanin
MAMLRKGCWILAAALWSRGLAAQTDSLPSWVQADTAAHTVHFDLETRAGDGGTALINGHRKGDLQLVVPVGWTVRWTWQNADSSASHSLVVMTEREKIPAEGGRPVFTNALTRAVTSGLRPGQKDETIFTAEEAGWYWVLCGVPGHALAGEWIGLRVDPAAKTVGVKSGTR